jgi:hypothetical protein
MSNKTIFIEYIKDKYNYTYDGEIVEEYLLNVLENDRYFRKRIKGDETDIFYYAFRNRKNDPIIVRQRIREVSP